MSSSDSSPQTSPKSTETTTTTMTSGSPTKAQAAIKSLSSILPSPLPVSSTPSATFLLNSPEVSTQISNLLRQQSSGSGDNHLCRWLYDTFQSSDPSLQLVVLRFIPLISGLYLARVTQRQPLAGFEAILLALYAYETTSRNGQAISVTIPDLSNPSIYHETTSPQPNNSTNLNIAVISPSLEPHGTIRSTRRARIIGVAMELFFSKIWVMPLESKLDFCEFVNIWAGIDGDVIDHGGDKNKGNNVKNGTDRWRLPLPWELLQPCLRILGHCLLGESGKGKKELHEKACNACKSLYARALHDVNPKALLAFGSLLKVVKMEKESDDFQHTEVGWTRVISI